MDAVFLKVLNMSAAASWMVLAVVVLRQLLKNAPRWLICFLWALVAVRLICPLSVKSELSLIPESVSSGETVMKLAGSYSGPSSSYWGHTEEFDFAVESGIDPIYAGEAGGEHHYYVITGEDPETPVGTVYGDLTPVWILGMVAMLLYALVSFIRVRRRVAPSVALSEELYLCDYIETPFILGIVKPKIYLPSSMDPNAAAHVLSHERAHIRRKDHWWKPFGYVLLSIHWFNPLMWLAYVLLCRDIEMACDEKVIRQMEPVDKKAYSEALLSCSVPRHMIAACPLAFGEVGVAQRVKSVLSYKKPGLWLVVMTVVLCIVVAVCFLTDPVGNSIGKLAGIENAEYESVSLTAEGDTLELFDAGDIRKVVRFMERTELEETPISQNCIERDSDYGITLGQTTICFDDYFSYIWINDGVKPSFPYLLKDQEGAKKFFEDMFDTIISYPEPTEPVDVPEGEDPYFDEEIPFLWMHSISDAYVSNAAVWLREETRTWGAYTISELDRLLALLNQVPENAITPAEAPESYQVRIAVYSSEAEREARFEWNGNCVYFSFHSANDPDTVWKVEDTDLQSYMEEVYSYKEMAAGFAGSEFAWEGELVTVSNAGATVSMRMLVDWWYEIVEYKQTGDSFGIRCRPEAVADGWVYYSYWPEGFDETGDIKCHVRDYDDPENFAVILEGDTDWIADYDDQFHDLDLHAECILENTASFNMINANMQLTLPEGWEYKIQGQKEEIDPFGIKFRPIDQEGWLKLLFWPEGFSVCGTGLMMDNALNLSNGLKASAGYYDGNEIWSFLRFYDLPGDYIVLNDGADSWIPAYETEIMRILNHAVLADGIITQAEAEAALQNVAGDISYTDKQWKYDYRLGVWTVELTQEDPDIVQIYRFDHMGNVITGSE